jgi:hypothetical protein
MMNNTKRQWELEWISTWDRKDGIHHYNYRKATSNQHRLSSNIPDMDSQVQDPSWHDDGRIQVSLVAGHIIFAMILNCASISSLQLQHTWRPNRLNPQDSASKRSVQNIIKLSLEIHKVTNIKLFHIRFITISSCVHTVRCLNVVQCTTSPWPQA